MRAEGNRGIARALAHMKKPRQSLEYLEKALQAGARKSETFKALADLHFGQLEKPGQAEDYYRQYLDALDPKVKADPGVYLNLGRLLSASSREEAVGFYEKAVEQGLLDILGPDSAEVKKEMGLLYVKLCRWRQASDSLTEYHKSLGAGREEERLVIDEILTEHVLPKLLEEEKKKDGGK